MDVGNPSNFCRILQIFEHSFTDFKQLVSSFSYSDNETKQAIKDLHKKYNYVADPHGAVAYLGLKEYLKNHNQYGIFLETAHPVKFLDVVQPLISENINIPAQIQLVINKNKNAVLTKNYGDLKNYLCNK
jgi:threonine synthase